MWMGHILDVKMNWMERGKGRGQEVDARGLKEEDFEGDVRKVNAIQSTTRTDKGCHVGC